MIRHQSVKLGRRALWVLPLAVFTLAGFFDALHAYIGHVASGRQLALYSLQGHNEIRLLDVVLSSLPSWMSMGLLAALALHITERVPLFAATWKRSLAIHLPLAILFAGAQLILASLFRHYFYVAPVTGAAYATTVVRYYAFYFNIFFMFYWGIVGVYSAFVYYAGVRQRELVTEQLRHGLTEARLQALRHQLHPHFLFNTLNAISALALEGNREATVESLALLGTLLRATLDRQAQAVTLAEELELLDLYIALQRLRFDDRLDIRIAIDDALLECEVPSFLLQPLVENAVRHGVARAPGAAWIEIRAVALHHRIRITVTDSGRGLPAGRPVQFGIGLSNCASRLKQIYGDAASLRLENAPEAGTRVTVELPASARIPCAQAGSRHRIDDEVDREARVVL